MHCLKRAVMPGRALFVIARPLHATWSVLPAHEWIIAGNDNVQFIHFLAFDK